MKSAYPWPKDSTSKARFSLTCGWDQFYTISSKCSSAASESNLYTDKESCYYGPINNLPIKNA